MNSLIKKIESLTVRYFIIRNFKIPKTPTILHLIISYFVPHPKYTSFKNKKWVV